MPKLVVIADNVPEVRETLRQTIEQLYEDKTRAGDLRVDTYEDGNGVVSLCALTVPDLVILDVDMPGLDGIQTFYCIREVSRAAAARVVFLTGFVGSGEVRGRIDRAVADGACGCLPKPATAADIKSLLDSRVFGA
ncbi:MAG TPA: response regulator [Thermoanaerobaculaceae bacterium]|nr:response regulator [Thermoanaerobaculaceae bacterium]